MSDEDLVMRGDVKAYKQSFVSGVGICDILVSAVTVADIDAIPAFEPPMSAVEYARHHGRMCSKSHFIFCNGCPLYSINYDCVEFERDHPEEAIAIVKKWAEEHPEEANDDA